MLPWRVRWARLISEGDLRQPKGVGAWQWSGKGSVQRWKRGPILGLAILTLPLLPMAHPKVIGQVTMLFSINGMEVRRG